MTQQDDDLKALWQSSPAIDTADLLKRVGQERRRMSRLFWFEVVGTVLALGLFVFYETLGLFGDRSWAAWTVVTAAIGMQIWMWYWRRGLWDHVSQAPMDLLRLQLKRAKVGLRIAKWYAYGTPIITVLAALFSFYLLPEAPSLDLPQVWRVIILIALLAMVVGMTAFGVAMMKRYRARIEWIESRIDALAGADQ